MNLKTLLQRTLALLSVMTMAALAQDTTMTLHVSPRFAGATDGPKGTVGVTPCAYFVEVKGLEPNTAYENHNSGAIGLIAANSTSTRGNYWNGTAWVSPSTVSPFATTDANGSIARWIYIRPPSNFPTGVDTFRVRLRLRKVGTTAFFSFDNVSPFNISAVRVDSATVAPRAGAIVYGNLDTTSLDNAGKFILAYENANDPRPLAAWLVQKHGIDGDRTLDTLNTSGYFQLVVPANTSIQKLEIRDVNNVVRRSQISSQWKSGGPGSATSLDQQDDVLLAVKESPRQIPEGYQLLQSYPNPLRASAFGRLPHNAGTSIAFSIPRREHVMLIVFDVLGRRVATLVDEALPAGSRVVQWNGLDDFGKAMPSGLYLYKLLAGGFAQTKKLLLLK